MDIQQLEARIKDLEAKNSRLEAVDEITKLQRIYGYYVERGQYDEVAELFSDRPDVTLDMSGIIQVGKENVRKIFSTQRPFGVSQGPKPRDYLHLTIPVSGVVDVNPDGKTAQGRWYALMYLCNATPGGGAVLGVGIYENDYTKEDGVWKIKYLRFDDIFLSPYEDGWAKTPKVMEKLAKMPDKFGLPASAPYMADPDPNNSPFGGPLPFHYKHPVTGK